MTEHEADIVLPGDVVTLSSPRVGPGLCVLDKDCSTAVVSIPGLLKRVGPEEERKKKRTWVDYSAKRVSSRRLSITHIDYISLPVCTSVW